MATHPTPDPPQTPFASLQAQLHARGYHVRADGPKLIALGFAGDDGPHRVMEIVCVPRPSDSDRDWFRSGEKWLAPADDPIEAAIAVAGELRPLRRSTLRNV